VTVAHEPGPVLDWVQCSPKLSCRTLAEKCMISSLDRVASP
jgi:hypothetical protein